MEESSRREKDLPMTEEFEYVRGIDPNGRSVNVPKSLFGGNLDVASEEVLGGIKASPKSETDTNEVKIDPNTGKLYCPPSEVAMATAEKIGGIVADVKTSEETEEVKIDPSTGKAYVKPSSKLEMATSETLGGVKANPATDNDTQEVHITEDGFLVTQPTTGGENEGVTGVKGNAETSYRKGNVNITPANIGLGNVNNTADSDKSVMYATSSGSSIKAIQDANGNVISETYATKTEMSNAESIANEANEKADSAETSSEEALNIANEAKTVANTAKNAVVTLEGLANTTTAQETLAAQVVQIEENKQNVASLNEKLFDKTVTGSRNLCNPSEITSDYYMNNSGTLKSNASYSVTGYIPIKEGQTLVCNSSSDSTSTYHALYDSDKSVVKLIQGTKYGQAISWEEGAAYVRFTTFDAKTSELGGVQVELGTTSTPFVEYVPSSDSFGARLKGSVMPDSVVMEDELYDEISTGSKNLCNPSEIKSGYYMNNSGTLKTNSDYSVTGYIPIKEGQSLVCNASAVSTSAYHAWYDADKNILSTVVGSQYGQSMSWIEGAAYVRFTTFNTKASELGGIQVELGTTSTAFEEYAPGTLTKKIKPELLPELDGKSNSFESFRKSGTVSPSGSLYLASIHIRKNTLLSACVKGEISSVSLGLGYSTSSANQYRDYDSVWAELTQTEIKIYKSYSGDYQLKNTYTHGMALTDCTFIEMDTTIEDGVTVSKLRLFNDVGALYEQTITSGVGQPFFTNNGSTSLNVEISFFARDLVRKIWCFGDSYFSFEDSSRWPYHLTRYGFDNWLSNNQPGLKPQLASTELENLLSSGWKPVILFWCLGMNGDTSESTDSNGNYVINSYQKTYLDKVVSICNENGITLVLATIPTVPARQKTGYNNYVKNLGVRYVDFADAVGATSSGVWNEGLLSSDNVHPSALGGKVLAAKVLVDFPEICIVE